MADSAQAADAGRPTSPISEFYIKAIVDDREVAAIWRSGRLVADAALHVRAEILVGLDERFLVGNDQSIPAGLTEPLPAALTLIRAADRVVRFDFTCGSQP